MIKELRLFHELISLTLLDALARRNKPPDYLL